MLRWVDGTPVPTSAPIINKQSQNEIAIAAGSLPYRGTKDPETGLYYVEDRFQGMSNIEVMWCRLAESMAHGDMDATKIYLDRTQGRPKQSVESVSVSLTYSDFLNQCIEEEEGETVDAEYSEVEKDVIDGI